MGCRLIADGGSSKVHWAVVDGDGRVKKTFFSKGVNPFVTGEDVIREVFEREVKAELEGMAVERVEFYGAGCRDHGIDVMRSAIRWLVGDGADVVVDSDMAGACLALLGEDAGVACILGTGVNSCYYEGGAIVEKVPSLGYVLGDEGSGAWLGKRVAADAIQGLLPKDLCRDFFSFSGLTGDEIVRRVYRPAYGEDAPNRFLAGFAPFLSCHIGRVEIRAIVEAGFRSFFRRSVAPYFTTSGRDVTVNFVGSIASVFEDVLRDVASADGYVIGKIIRSPMDGLLEGV